MKVVSIDLPESLPKLEVHVASDWHIGDKNCKLSQIKAELEQIKDSETDYLILNGDLMNNATKASISDSYSELIPPMTQITMLVELLEPVKDKILFVTCGNHEARTYRESGIDLMALVCAQLGVTNRYAREGGVLYVRFGKVAHDNKRKQTYSFYVTHGSGGGRKEGAKAIRLADMAAIVDTDIYIHSHTHLPFIMKEDFYRTDAHTRTCCKVTHLFVNTAASLDYGGYGQTYEFKPSSTDNPVIHLLGSHKKYMATL